MQANILIDNDGCARIADFGLASIGPELYDEGPDTYGGQGSLRWQAPELIISTGNVTTQSDVYAFAILCWEVSNSFTWVWSSNILIVPIDFHIGDPILRPSRR